MCEPLWTCAINKKSILLHLGLNLWIQIYKCKTKRNIKCKSSMANNIFFQPFVGKHYADGGMFGKRILILGESHYCEADCGD